MQEMTFVTTNEIEVTPCKSFQYADYYEICLYFLK